MTILELHSYVYFIQIQSSLYCNKLCIPVKHYFTAHSCSVKQMFNECYIIRLLLLPKDFMTHSATCLNDLA